MEHESWTAPRQCTFKGPCDGIAPQDRFARLFLRRMPGRVSAYVRGASVRGERREVTLGGDPRCDR